MQKSELTPSPVYGLPRWARTSIAVFVLAVAVLMMWERLLRLDWVPLLCVGLYYLIYVPRQKGEAFAAYIKKPRATASFALLLAAVTASLYALYTLSK